MPLATDFGCVFGDAILRDWNRVIEAVGSSHAVFRARPSKANCTLTRCLPGADREKRKGS